VSAGPLHGRHALVTGAGRGIGAEVARTLAREGAVLTLLGRQEAPLRRLAGELPGAGHGVVLADVTRPEPVEAAFREARAARGPLAILVANAGQAESAPFARTSPDLWSRMLAVNLTGTFLCAREALPDLLRAGPRGRMVFVASTAGRRGYPYVSAYVAAKHGVIGLMRSLALEVADRGVTVNAVCPGFTETDLLHDSVARIVAATGRTPAQVREELAAGSPQRRFVTPAEVADTVRWLCGDGAGAVTGQAISVSGGEVMA
jgi:NAD(P)-dependent dehydrogenase (short-subunit alcohol dehydrogenase family)